jgi:RNA polymerase sigma-70 factor (ECF subfamily)
VSGLSSTSSSGLGRAERLDFDRVYREHFRFVWSTLLRLGVPRDAVEDACQETFLVVHRRIDDFHADGSPRAWLFGIARRVAYRVRRSQDRTRRKISALRGERPGSKPLEDAVAQQQLSALLLDALDELDDDKREALSLHVFEELSGPEVAAMLGLKVDTAYSRIKAGRRALKRVLGARGVEADMAPLVRATRSETEPRPGARGRMAALLSVSVRSSPLVGVVGSAWKAVAVVAALGALVVTGAALRPPAPAAVAVSGFGTRLAAVPPPVHLDAPEPKPAALLPSPDVSPESVETVSRRPERAASPSKSPSVSTEASPSMALRNSTEASPSMALRKEVELIDRATAALRREEPGAALVVLSEHARRFPSGQLATERRTYRAVALCAAGKTPQGRAEARLVRALRPSKALLAWLDDACGPQDAADPIPARVDASGL